MYRNYSLMIYIICWVLLLAGLFCLKSNSNAAWSLRNRSYLRTGITNGIRKCKNLDFARISAKYRTLGLAHRISQINRKERLNKEIFESISFLRNIASIGKGKTSSTDSVLQTLAEQNGLLQPIYSKMLSLLRLNKVNEAAALFSEAVDTPAGRDFARILLQWDKIDPEELSETLLSQEKSMKEIRITAQKRKDEMISDLIYFPVIVNILLIFINFIYVSYFIDQKEMLEMFL